MLEKKFQKLLKEETKGSRLQIPISLIRLMLKYQKAYRLLHNKKISREHIIIKMMVSAMDWIKTEIAEMKKEALQKQDEDEV